MLNCKASYDRDGLAETVLSKSRDQRTLSEKITHYMLSTDGPTEKDRQYISALRTGDRRLALEGMAITSLISNERVLPLLSVRLVNLFENMGIFTVEQLCQKSALELIEWRGFGMKSLRATEEIISIIGMSLKTSEFPV
jgi:hypothetical protein